LLRPQGHLCGQGKLCPIVFRQFTNSNVKFYKSELIHAPVLNKRCVAMGESCATSGIMPFASGLSSIMKQSGLASLSRRSAECWTLKGTGPQIATIPYPIQLAHDARKAAGEPQVRKRRLPRGQTIQAALEVRDDACWRTVSFSERDSGCYPGAAPRACSPFVVP
jgi:hypothetical protein